LTRTGWVQSLDTREDIRGKTYRICQKQKSLLLREFLSTGRNVFDVLFTISLKQNITQALTTKNTIVKNYIITNTHAQNTNVLQLNVFLN